MFQNTDGRICCARARLLGPSEEFSAAACQALEEVQPFSGHSRPFHRPHHRQGCVTCFATASVRWALTAAGGSGLEGLGALELAGQTAAGGILGRTAAVPGRATVMDQGAEPTDDQGFFSLILGDRARHPRRRAAEFGPSVRPPGWPNEATEALSHHNVMLYQWV